MDKRRALITIGIIGSYGQVLDANIVWHQMLIAMAYPGRQFLAQYYYLGLGLVPWHFDLVITECVS